MDNIKIAIYIIIFFVYSYFGAVFEHISYYLDPDSKKLLQNPIIEGFPLYGMGALLIYLLIKLLNLNMTEKNSNGDNITKNNIANIFSIFTVGAVIGTLIEYFVGMNVGAGEFSGISAEEAKKGISSWDYRGEPYNYKGIISLRHFITWGLAGIFIAWFTPGVENELYRGLR